MKTLLTLFLAGMVTFTYAQLEPWTDFETSEEVNVVSTTKVSENMIPYYLEGLSKVWLPATQFQKEKGYVKDFKVFVSDLPNSGDFNVVTWITFANDAAVRGSKKRFDEIQAHLNSLSSENERDEVVTKSYPSMRKIVGQYRLRAVEFK